MSLPNYAPTGQVLFGSVPWDNKYTNVRLYSDLSSQYNDIVSRMTLSSSGYKYIARNRTLDVSIEADRMYHCNYCMYKNNSLTDGWIYCFITDVQYVNDHTSRITLETDVFHTYLYNVDWIIPPAFIERETVPSESSKYLLTNEPATNLLYTITGETSKLFKPKGIIIVSADKPKRNDSLIDDIFNPEGYSAEPAQISVYKGIVKGANYYYCPYGDASIPIKDAAQTFINSLTVAGAVESIVCIFTVPEGFSVHIDKDSWNEDDTWNNNIVSNQGYLALPPRGDTVDGYTPLNKKLLYYPYTYCTLTDYQGNKSDLLYEQLDSTNVMLKYVPNEQCSMLVVPDYMGVQYNLNYGFATPCGTQCSWINDTFKTWLAQNSWGIMSDIGEIVSDVISAGTSLGAANAALNNVTTGAHMASSSWGKHTSNSQLRSFAEENVSDAQAHGIAGLSKINDTANTISFMSKRPDHVKGNTSIDLMVATGMQGIRGQRMQVRKEFAEQLDKFFSRWGYSVNRIESVNITSRPSWNYVKTGGAAAKSYNTGAGTKAPFTRGRGTPAAALNIINQAFDRGVTFWHTTSNFGNFNLDNSL